VVRHKLFTIAPLQQPGLDPGCRCLGGGFRPVFGAQVAQAHARGVTAWSAPIVAADMSNRSNPRVIALGGLQDCCLQFPDAPLTQLRTDLFFE